ncbi:SusC/RagA family TonB-linked outer membrane protein [Flavobacterium kingsejongi]|uniref:SusC/RagA family TonB-linked outer membrane protein n=1 Tax=Flavobacterium kingsejongi TaxID=1678728 RepID=A0A2S1LNG0_9FLAO|nr:SusC/RagA family TonB-linked outer membrane protein [Flavobacterium kingsejongi]AWG25307.1 SusC/RagA family TonB-linked outer membrane protein [Flavobacterium kingsejongi]
MKMKLNHYLGLLMILFMQSITAQDITVSGVVSDASGLPLPGANVVVKNSTNGTQTDMDGKYSIKTQMGQTLSFSFLGLNTHEAKVTSSNLNVSLQESQAEELEGVVITALGIKREKKSLGYSSQEVKGSIISEAGQTNALSGLSGNVAGLQVTAPSTMGGSTRIVLRGVGSVSGENRPLIVIDGIPLDNGNINSATTQRGAGGRDYGDATADINPNDIESVTVLKGGPASALYGSRAGNGAILYTTKSGKKGKTEIIFNSGLTLESINIMPDLQKQYGGGGSQTFETATINGQTYNIADYATDSSWGPKYDANLKYLPWNAFDTEFPNDHLKEKSWVSPKNDVKSFFNTGVTRNNSIALSKSFQDGSLRFSYGNTQTEGIVPNSKLQKNTFNLNVNSKLTDRLKAEAMVNFTQTKGFNRPEVGYGDNSLAQKFFHFGQRQLDYNDLKAYKLANGNQRSWNRTAYDDATPAYSDNPYWTVYENTSEDKRNRLYGNAKLTYNFTPDFYAVGNVYMDTYNFSVKERVAIGSQAQSSYSQNNITLMDINYEGRLHYNKTFGDFSLNTFAGVNRRQYTRTQLLGNTVGGLVLPDLFSLNNSRAQALAQNSESEKRTNSVYGFVSLGYKDMLFVEATNRNDWFSTVVRSSNYSSVTGSFVFSTLLPEVNWLSFGKIRGGWAQTGNDTDPYSLENYKTINQPFNSDPRYSNPRILNNPNLKPELKETTEFGLEARLFDSRIGLDVSIYKTTTNDLITPIAVDPATGFTSQYFNAGKLENKGIEATVNITPVRTEDFSWDITWNFAKNKNKLLELKEGTETLLLAQAPFRARLLAEVGQPYGQIYGTDYVYDANGNKMIGENGMYLASEQKSLGTTTPDYNMGLRNTIRYKNVSLTILIDRQKGGSYYSMNHMFGSYSGMLENTVANGIRENGIILEGVQADGSVNTVPITAQTYGEGFFSTVDKQNVFDADYFKLREVALSYTLPKSFVGPFDSIQISAFGRNLLTWGLDWKGMDPEMASYGSGNVQGIDGGSLPSTRTYGMNVQFKF